VSGSLAGDGDDSREGSKKGVSDSGRSLVGGGCRAAERIRIASHRSDGETDKICITLTPSDRRETNLIKNVPDCMDAKEQGVVSEDEVLKLVSPGDEVKESETDNEMSANINSQHTISEQLEKTVLTAGHLTGVTSDETGLSPQDLTGVTIIGESDELAVITSVTAASTKSRQLTEVDNTSAPVIKSTTLTEVSAPVITSTTSVSGVQATIVLGQIGPTNSGLVSPELKQLSGIGPLPATTVLAQRGPTPVTGPEFKQFSGVQATTVLAQRGPTPVTGPELRMFRKAKSSATFTLGGISYTVGKVCT